MATRLNPAMLERQLGASSQDTQTSSYYTPTQEAFRSMDWLLNSAAYIDRQQVVLEDHTEPITAQQCIDVALDNSSKQYPIERLATLRDMAQGIVAALEDKMRRLTEYAN